MDRAPVLTLSYTALAEVLSASFLPFYWQYEGIWTQFSRCRGGAWWPVAFSNLLKKQHSPEAMLMLPLADMIAASVLFYPRAQYTSRGQCGHSRQSSQNAEVVSAEWPAVFSKLLV